MANDKTILVVDDDPGARRLLQFVLAKTGCEILTASDGAQALDIASRQTIQLLVTDVMMAGVDGLKLTQALRQMPAYATLPIIMLSARWKSEYQDEVGLADNVTLLTKPFSPIELISQINLLLKM
jgi:DNA-binding response OmpR family regulator